jgi:hypothetical protein
MNKKGRASIGVGTAKGRLRGVMFITPSFQRRGRWGFARSAKTDGTESQRFLIGGE